MDDLHLRRSTTVVEAETRVAPAEIVIATKVYADVRAGRIVGRIDVVVFGE